jgi:hypothetical protein
MFQKAWRNAIVIHMGMKGELCNFKRYPAFFQLGMQIADKLLDRCMQSGITGKF